MTLDLSRDFYNKSTRHLVEVQLILDSGTWTMPFESGTLTFDEDNYYIEAQIQGPVPSDEIVESIDPRALPTMIISLGYQLPNGVTDFEEICRLDVRERAISRPENFMRLTATSRENRLHDSKSVPTLRSFSRSTSAGGAIIALINKYDPGQTVQNYLTSYFIFDSDENFGEELGEDPWNTIQEILDRTGGRCFWDGSRWVITPDITEYSAPALHLLPGPTGNLKQYEARLARELGWYNSVVTRYRWTDASDVEQEVIGEAEATGAPLGVDSVGRRSVLIDSELPATTTSADAKALTILNRTITRGREIIITALSAYWLRPLDTIVVTTVPGKTELQLVKSVQFTLESGEMNIKTRRLEDAQILGE